MARDGSGNYTRVAGPYVGGTTILKDNINDELDDLGNEITNSINKNGTKAFAADQPMGGFKLTGLAAGSANGDSVRYEQVQPIDATLTAFAALTTADDRMLDFTGVDTMAVVTYASVLTNLGISPAWTTSTPTITAGSGTITTVSCTLRKLTIGKTVYFQAAITVTTNGTGAGHLKLPLGFTPSATQCANGFNAATAVTLGCQTSGTDLLIFDRDGAYPAASAQSLYVGGVMEST